MAARVQAAQPTGGEIFTLYATAAVILGGTSLYGGRGSVLRTIFGVALIALLQNGRLDQAREQLVLANKLQPGMPETLYALGKAASMQGDNAVAIDALTRVVTLEPAGPLAAQAHFALSGIYRKQAKTAEAGQEMQQYQKLKAAAPPGAPADPSR